MGLTLNAQQRQQVRQIRESYERKRRERAELIAKGRDRLGHPLVAS